MNHPVQQKIECTRETLANLSAQLAALREMTVGQLRERYFEVYGEPTRSRNKDYLFKKVAWRIQELAEGGLSESALAQIDSLAKEAPIRWRSNPPVDSMESPEQRTANDDPQIQRDPRLPAPGTVLTRSYKGVDHKVTVLENDFEYQGERFGSLSRLARKITGTRWNLCVEPDYVELKDSKCCRRDARLPPVGTTIRKFDKEQVHEILVLADGFEYRGKTYRSLSAVARVATGTVWNGYLWAKKALEEARRECLASPDQTDSELAT